jgi:hypothetical protein
LSEIAIGPPDISDNAHIPKFSFRSELPRGSRLERTFEADVSMAIEFAANLAQRVREGSYDDDFEPYVTAIVGTVDRNTMVQFLEGYKGG